MIYRKGSAGYGLRAHPYLYCSHRGVEAHFVERDSWLGTATDYLA